MTSTSTLGTSGRIDVMGMGGSVTTFRHSSGIDSASKGQRRVSSS